MRNILKIVCAVLFLFSGTAVLADDVLTLGWQDCVKEAIKGNPSLAASVQIIRQNKAESWISASPFLPQISGSASASKSDSFTNNANRDKSTYSIKGSQLIFDGFKTYNNVKSAKENVRSSEYGYIGDSSDVRYNLRKAFVELLRAQALIPIGEGIVARRKQNLDMIQLSYDSGREHEGSLLLARADMEKAEFDLRKAKRDVSVAQYALRKEMGWENNIPIRVVGNFKTEVGRIERPNLKDIADNHPLVKKAEAVKDSAKYGVEAAKAEFFPEFSFSGEAGKVNPGGFTDDKGWTVGINMSMPFFEGGRRIASTQKAKAKLLQTRSDEKRQHDNAISTLEKAWQNLQDAIDNVDVQAKYLKAAEVRAKISRAEYANGLIIFDNWIIIEDNYIGVQRTYVNAEADMLIAEADWIRAKGGNLEYE